MNLTSTMAGTLVINGIEDEYIFETIKKSGDFYEADLLRKWTPYFIDVDCILDIGANIGNHSLYWSVYTKAQKIYAFEPLPLNYDILCKNVADNQLNSKILCCNDAVGARNGSVILESLDEKNMGTAHFAASETETDIKMISIDSYYAAFDLPKVDFVKIDTEGFEVFVLNGMDNVIAECLPVFWIEAGPTTITDVLSIMALYGYVVVSIHASNLLFLHPDKHENAKPLDINQVLPEFIHHVERRNQYYGLYLKLNDENSHIKKAYRESELRIEEYRGNWQKALDDNKKLNDDNKKVNNDLRESEIKIQDIQSRLDNANALYRQSEERIAAFKGQVTELTQAKEELLEKYAAVYGALSSTLVSYRQVKTIVYSLQLNVSKYDKKVLDYDKKIREYDKKIHEHDKKLREYNNKIREYKKKIDKKNKAIIKANDRIVYLEGLIYGGVLRAVKHIIYHYVKNFASRHRIIKRPMVFGYRIIKSIRSKLHK